MKNAFSSRKFKGGAYTTILSVIVIFLVLMVNLVVSGLTRTKDLTGLQKYSLHDATKEFLNSYDVPIDLYYVCTVGEENKVIAKTVENFAAQGKNINLIQKDPKLYPAFVFQYTGGEKQIDNNSIILVRHDDDSRYVYIEYELMCLYYVNQKDLTNITKELAGYNAEAEIMKGLVKLSDELNSVVYVATGHGEQMISDGRVSDSIESVLTLNSYTVRYVDLKKKPVPSDCDALLILGARDDLSEEECTAVKNYMTAGGRVMWFLTFETTERPNMQALLKYYGLNLEEGMLCERDTNYTTGENPENVLAQYGKKNTAWYYGVGLTKLPSVRDSLSVNVVASSSSTSYLTPDLKDRAYKSGYQTGSFPLLTAVTDTYQENAGKMYIFNTQYFLRNDVFMAGVSYANSEVFIKYLGDLCNKQSNISVPSISNYEEALKLTTHQKNVLLVVLVGIIPGLILLAGIVVVFLRRR
ncbi:MAG: Gldg family protein [Lachnospiraceae bacterium]|nr:Gldg family protein [Lachnospiraceae bacterium]